MDVWILVILTKVDFGFNKSSDNLRVFSLVKTESYFWNWFAFSLRVFIGMIWWNSVRHLRNIKRLIKDINVILFENINIGVLISLSN